MKSRRELQTLRRDSWHTGKLVEIRNDTPAELLDLGECVRNRLLYAAQPLEIRQAKRRLRDLKLPPRPAKRTDSVAILVEDRRRRPARSTRAHRPCPAAAMIAYIDTSALLRIVLRETGALVELRTYEGLVSNELIAVESARTLDRLRLQGALTTAEAAERMRKASQWLEAMDLVLLRPPVLSRASEPMPTPIRTLGAIHLATFSVESSGWAARRFQH